VTASTRVLPQNQSLSAPAFAEQLDEHRPGRVKLRSGDRTRIP
jgi:hypothetical protein